MFKILFVGVFLVTNVLSESSDEKSDPFLDYFFYGRVDSLKYTDSKEDSTSSDSIWKCGNCSDLTLPYFEEVYYNEEDMNNSAVENKMTIQLNRMKCVTVSSPTKAVVQHVEGSCDGPEVTITIAPTERYVLRVYQ